MTEHVLGCYFKNQMQPQRDDVCVQAGGACEELPDVSFEEFTKSLDEAEAKIMGEGMVGMDKAKWHCTVCGVSGVGISTYTHHIHPEPTES